MPLNKEIKKALVIGSGPIVIGQAAEFDYAGTQACRALREDLSVVPGVRLFGPKKQTLLSFSVEGRSSEEIGAPPISCRNSSLPHITFRLLCI